MCSGETSTSGGGPPFGSGCMGGIPNKDESGASRGASGAMGTPWGSMARVRTVRAFVPDRGSSDTQLFCLLQYLNFQKDHEKTSYHPMQKREDKL